MKKTLLLIFGLSILFSEIVKAQTVVPGGVVSGTWNLAGSPYQVQGTIQVPNGQTLTINPGVTVEFEGHYKFLVQGRLIAIGTSVDSISFTAANTVTGWWGIRFSSTPTTNDTSKFFYCKVQYGRATGSSPDDYGGGFYINNFSKVIISNSRLSNNSAISLAGAILVYTNSSPIIKNNMISNNTATYWTGGIYVGDSDPTITGNKIVNNSSMYGAGMAITGGTANPVVAYNMILNNTATSIGGGLEIESDPVVLDNNLIANNTGGSGGGVYCRFPHLPNFTNCTIANNTATNGGALYCDNGVTPSFVNCILYGNTASTAGPQVFLFDDASDPNFNYCDVQGGSAAIDANGNFYSGTYTNNINSVPLFVAPSGGAGSGFSGSSANFSLQATSPCINTGDPTMITPSTDLAGNPRITVCRIDQGAYEYQNGVPFGVTITQTSPILCAGYLTGALQANATGSGTPYTYLWSPGGATTSSISGLGAGIYTVTSTNATGCSRTATFTITEPLGMSLTHSQTDINCNGNCTGSATVNVTGGTGPFTYSWNTAPVQTTAATTATLCTGGYTVTVTDGGGCTATTNVTITTPGALSFTATLTNISCHGGSNGSIVINAVGGVAPLTYSKDGGTTFISSNTFSSLPAGTYNIVVKDNNGCQTSVTPEVLTDPAALTLTTSQTDLNCNGLCNGQATVVATGGTPSYTYSWTTAPVQTTAATTATLCAGTYTVTVTDNAGCTATTTVTIISTLPIVPICLVTVDTPSVYNVIDWDKPITSQIDSFRIYREVTTAVYAQVGSVSYDSLSEFIDITGADPNATSFKYKLSVIDTCGGESAMSLYHNTIHLQVLGLGNLQWTLYDIETMPNPVTFYRVLRSDDGILPFVPISSTIPGGNTTYTDVAYASYPAAIYRVDVAWSISCNPTRTLINTTRSNIKHQNLTMSISPKDLNEEIWLYPNPTNNEATIELSGIIKTANIKIYNSLGQKVYEELVNGSGVAPTMKHIDVTNYAKGVYTISIESYGTKVFKKLVVN